MTSKEEEVAALSDLADAIDRLRREVEQLVGMGDTLTNTLQRAVNVAIANGGR